MSDVKRILLALMKEEAELLLVNKEKLLQQAQMLIGEDMALGERINEIKKEQHAIEELDIQIDKRLAVLEALKTRL